MAPSTDQFSHRSYDVVIVGGGSAGCVLANRLSADPSCRVLLLEAGRRQRSVLIRMPAAFPYASTTRRFSWGYSSEPEPFLDGRRIPCPGGRLLGGSSAINAMAFARGHPHDFDDWAAKAGDQWSYANSLDLFKSLEHFGGGENDYRGGSGPLSVIAPKYSNRLNEIFLTACADAGFPLSDDVNGADPEGVGPMDQTISNGERASAASAFLDPIRGRRNLTVLTGALVTRILFEGKRAIGVEVAQKRGRLRITAGETILSAGAINSPRLLMLSGVGAADELVKLGIRPVADRPQVGKNLQDHVDVSLLQACTAPISVAPLLAPHRKLQLGLQWIFTRKGPGSTNHFEVAGYIRSTPDASRPDIQLCLIPMLVSTAGKRMGHGHGFQVAVMLLRPKSRGSIALRGADPRLPPLIRFNYLAEPEDIVPLREGIRTLRRILAQPVIAGYLGTELAPQEAVRSDEALDAFIRANAKSTHHPCGSCRMGMDEESVVDGFGRARGVRGLRIADASIMPSVTSANINAPTMMIAERIARHIQGAKSSGV